mmetsp:Transcript_7451/g.18516  ORF Transcript_7451/g.18516 Transcript_7451/m.18516 type:complete len:439 (-) Transcript_7451:88-1404(-)
MVGYYVFSRAPAGSTFRGLLWHLATPRCQRRSGKSSSRSKPRTTCPGTSPWHRSIASSRRSISNFDQVFLHTLTLTQVNRLHRALRQPRQHCQPGHPPHARRPPSTSTIASSLTTQFPWCRQLCSTSARGLLLRWARVVTSSLASSTPRLPRLLMTLGLVAAQRLPRSSSTLSILTMTHWAIGSFPTLRRTSILLLLPLRLCSRFSVATLSWCTLGDPRSVPAARLLRLRPFLRCLRLPPRRLLLVLGCPPRAGPTTSCTTLASRAMSRTSSTTSLALSCVSGSRFGTAIVLCSGPRTLTASLSWNDTCTNRTASKTLSFVSSLQRSLRPRVLQRLVFALGTSSPTTAFRCFAGHILGGESACVHACCAGNACAAVHRVLLSAPRSPIVWTAQILWPNAGRDHPLALHYSGTNMRNYFSIFFLRIFATFSLPIFIAVA